MALDIKHVEISAGEGTSFTSCAICKGNGKGVQMLRLATTAEVREGKPHYGTMYIHPGCFLENLPAIWAIDQFLPIVRLVFNKMAQAIGRSGV